MIEQLFSPFELFARRKNGANDSVFQNLVLAYVDPFKLILNIPRNISFRLKVLNLIKLVITLLPQEIWFGNVSLEELGGKVVCKGAQENVNGLVESSKDTEQVKDHDWGSPALSGLCICDHGKLKQSLVIENVAGESFLLFNIGILQFYNLPCFCTLLDCLVIVRLQSIVSREYICEDLNNSLPRARKYLSNLRSKMILKTDIC